jgi:hypothetical protein
MELPEPHEIIGQISEKLSEALKELQLISSEIGA